MTQPIVFDITKQLNQLNGLASSMPYIIKESLNKVAFEKGRDEVSNEMINEFEDRNKYFNSKNAIRVLRASKQSLEVTLYHFKEELGLQQFGGIETPKGKKLGIPVRKNLAAYAGVGQTQNIPKPLSLNNLMQNAPRKRMPEKGAYKVKGIKPFILNRGIFIRVDDSLRMLYSFVDKAEHQKKLLKMQEVIEKVYNENLENYLNDFYIKLLKG